MSLVRVVVFVFLMWMLLFSYFGFWVRGVILAVIGLIGYDSGCTCLCKCYFVYCSWRVLVAVLIMSD